MPANRRASSHSMGMAAAVLRMLEQNMWNDLLAAFALLLVLEGMLPFLRPAAMRRVWIQMAGMDDRALRIAGLLSMVGGVVMLYLVR